MKRSQSAGDAKQNEEATIRAANRFLSEILIPLIVDAESLSPRDALDFYHRFKHELSGGQPIFDLADVWRAALIRADYYEALIEQNPDFEVEMLETTYTTGGRTNLYKALDLLNPFAPIHNCTNEEPPSDIPY